MGLLESHPRLRTVLIVIALLGAVEGILRLVETTTAQPGEMASSPSLLWVPPGGDPREAGFDFGQGHGDGDRKAVFVGDSSVYGHAVQSKRAFPAAVAYLATGRVQTLNLAAPGYSSVQALRVLESVVPREKPDLVVVATLWSDNNFDAFVDADALAQRETGLFRFFYHANRTLSHSAIWRALLRGVGQFRPVFVRWGNRPADDLVESRRVPINDYAANLDAMVRLSRAHGADVLFLVLPNEEDFREPERLWPWHPYRQVMRDVARAHGARILDMPDELRSLGIDVATFFADEMHPTAHGHETIARTLVRRLEQWGWFEGNSLQLAPDGPLAEGRLDPLTSRPVSPLPEGLEDFRITGTLAALEGGAAQGDPGAARRVRYRLEAVAVHGDGEVLDSVVLPAAAGFILSPPRTTVQLRLARGEWHRGQVTWSGPARPLRDGQLDLTQGPVWAAVVDVEMLEFLAPPPLPAGWQSLLAGVR